MGTGCVSSVLGLDQSLSLSPAAFLSLGLAPTAGSHAWFGVGQINLRVMEDKEQNLSQNTVYMWCVLHSLQTTEERARSTSISKLVKIFPKQILE